MRSSSSKAEKVTTTSATTTSTTAASLKNKSGLAEQQRDIKHEDEDDVAQELRPRGLTPKVVVVQEKSETDHAIEAFLSGDEQNAFFHKLLDVHSDLFEKLVIEEQTHSCAEFLKHVLNLVRRRDEEDATLRRYYNTAGGGTTSEEVVDVLEQEADGKPPSRSTRGAGGASSLGKQYQEKVESLSRYLSAFVASGEGGDLNLDPATCSAILEQNPSLQKIKTRVNQQCSTH